MTAFSGQPFLLNGVTTKVTSAGATASGSIAAGNPTVLVTSVGSTVAYVRSSKGASSATTSDTPIIPNSAQTFAIQGDHDTVSVISASGTVDVYFTVGNGA